MSINVIDWKQATAAVSEMEDSATKKLLTQILPVAQAAMQTLSDHVQDRVDATVGNALGAVTAERQQFINDVHELLDRLNGTKVNLMGGMSGFALEVPPRGAAK